MRQETSLAYRTRGSTEGDILATKNLNALYGSARR